MPKKGMGKFSTQIGSPTQFITQLHLLYLQNRGGNNAIKHYADEGLLSATAPAYFGSTVSQNTVAADYCQNHWPFLFTSGCMFLQPHTILASLLI